LIEGSSLHESVAGPDLSLHQTADSESTVPTPRPPR